MLGWFITVFIQIKMQHFHKHDTGQPKTVQSINQFNAFNIQSAIAELYPNATAKITKTPSSYPSILSSSLRLKCPLDLSVQFRIIKVIVGIQVTERMLRQQPISRRSVIWVPK